MRLILHGGPCDDRQYDVNQLADEFRVVLPIGEHAVYLLAGVQDGFAHYSYVAQ